MSDRCAEGGVMRATSTQRIGVERCCDACALYTLRDLRHSESMWVYVCRKHSLEMPDVDGERVTAEPCENGIECDFTAVKS